MAHRDTLAQTIAVNRTERTAAVSKRGRKKRDRKKNASNHGKRPNS
jgi:hypothetical protein